MKMKQNPLSVIVLINTLAGAGAEKQVLITVAGLSKLGFRCSVFWLKNSVHHQRTTNLYQEACEAGVRFYAPAPGRELDLNQITKIRSVLRERPDSLLWTWGHRADFVGVIAKIGFCNVRLIGSMRSARVEAIDRYRWVWRLLNRTHSAFISNSARNVELVSMVAPKIVRKCTVIYNAIEPQNFSSQVMRSHRPSQLKVVMLGNHFVRVKGYDIVVQLAELIRDRAVPIQIHIGGAKVNGPSLEELIDLHRVSGVVKLLGPVHDPLEFLGTGDLFLMLSRYEGTPNALLEAMALGLPAICTRVGDVEVLFGNKKHARLIDGNAEAAFEAILELWNNWDQTLILAQAGRGICRSTFDRDVMIRNTANALAAISLGQTLPSGAANGTVSGSGAT